MLSPQINSVCTNLTNCFGQLESINSFAYTSNNTMVGYLADDPDWLSSVRSRIGMLSDSANGWFESEPDIRKNLIIPFINYATTFSSFADQVSKGGIKTSSEWTNLLNSVLVTTLDDCIDKTQNASKLLSNSFQPFKNVIPLIDQSIREGWSELAAEEKQMVALATALGALDQEVSNLQDKLTSDMISSGKSYVSSEVSIIYKLVSETGASVSFLSMASLALTIGMGIYNAVKASQKIADCLNNIANLQLKASQAAQAAAGTKLVLQLLYKMDIEFSGISDQTNALVSLWQNEKQKIQSVISALEAGAKPANYLDLMTLPVAHSNWQAICDFATKLSVFKTTSGEPVTLEPTKAEATKAN